MLHPPKKPTYNSAALESVHTTAAMFHEVSVLDYSTMHRFDKSCLSKPMICMQKRSIESVEVVRSSHNVFIDLKLPKAAKLKIKTGLVIEIRKAVRSLGLTQQAAAKRMKMPQPKVSRMMRGDFTNLSERKLMDCLNRLGYGIRSG